MKRKESSDKSKPNKDLANQLKARLFDKGISLLTQASATVLYLLSSDRSKTITIRFRLKVMPLSSPWAKTNLTTESLRNSPLSSRSQMPNNTPKKNLKRFKCRSFVINKKMTKIGSVIWHWVEFHLLKGWDLILEIIQELSCGPLKVLIASYQRLGSNFIENLLNLIWPH